MKIALLLLSSSSFVLQASDVLDNKTSYADILRSKSQVATPSERKCAVVTSREKDNKSPSLDNLEVDRHKLDDEDKMRKAYKAYEKKWEKYNDKTIQFKDHDGFQKYLRGYVKICGRLQEIKRLQEIIDTYCPQKCGYTNLIFADAMIYSLQQEEEGRKLLKHLTFHDDPWVQAKAYLVLSNGAKENDQITYYGKILKLNLATKDAADLKSKAHAGLGNAYLYGKGDAITALKHYFYGGCEGEALNSPIWFQKFVSEQLKAEDMKDDSELKEARKWFVNLWYKK